MEIITEGLEDIFEIPSDFLQKEGEKMIGKIKQDGLEGIFQNGRGNMDYKSKQYMKYKANGMNRLTHGGELRQTTVLREKDGNIKGSLENRLFGSKSYKFKHERIGAGQNKKTQKKQVYGSRLKEFEGIATNRDITKVNMCLTEHTYRGMKCKALQNGFEISFDPADSGKVLGNQKRGYDLVGLNEENKQIVNEDITKFIEKQIGEKLTKSITITIG